MLPLTGLMVFSATLYYVYSNLELPTAPPLAQTTYLTFRSGTPLTNFHSDVDRKVIPLDDMPESLRNAVIDTEDKDYYEHGGISPIGIIRALWADVTKGELAEGGSTITQQYVKQVFTGSERTFTRKIKEAMLAMKLEREFTKDEILAKYLNTIYFGHGAYGVQAAAKTYFGKDAKDLKPAESALLAGLIAAPSALDPFKHKADAKERRSHVIGRMLAEGHVTEEEAARMKDSRIRLVKETEPGYLGAFFAWYVRSQLEKQFGEERVTAGGLRVRTTLDPELQRLAEGAVREALPNPKDPEAALVAIDPATGEILAMVGGRSYTRPGQFNIATQARRQAGSAFKPFTLATALKQGYSLFSYWNGPSSITIDDSRCDGPDGPWTPSNADPGEAGGFSLASATAHSVNTVFAQLVVAEGLSPDRVARTAESLGIQSPMGDPVPCSITLGSQGVTPLEMTVAYSTIANQGVWHSPTSVMSVRAPDGAKVRYPSTREATRLDPNVANAVTEALTGVVEYGTGTGASLGARPVAGKTGTSQDYKNAWFCGYTAPGQGQIAACVWVGYKKTEKSMINVGGTYGPVYGGTIPASIWRAFMSDALDALDAPVASFPQPDMSGFTRGPSPPAPSPKPEKSPSRSSSPKPEVSPSASPSP